MCFICKHEDLSSTPKMQLKGKLMRFHALYKPQTGEVDIGKSQRLADLADTVSLVSSRPVQGPVSKGK